MSGAEIRYIPYRSTPQATADLMGGRISMIWLSSLGNLAGSDKVRPFAVTLNGERWNDEPAEPASQLPARTAGTVANGLAFLEDES
jgi:tripartite-type tricarboxylate transporter receptor subunit TctC